jgi:calpain-15
MGNTLIWKCKSCNFTNLSETSTCSQCMTLRPQSFQIMSGGPLPPSNMVDESMLLTMSTTSTDFMPPPPPPPPPLAQKSSSSLSSRLRLNHPKASQSTTNLKHILSSTSSSHQYTPSQYNTTTTTNNNNRHSRVGGTAASASSTTLTHFIDNDFPPVKQSLYMNGNSVKRSNLIHSNGFKQIKKWLRPHEVTVVTHEETHMPVTLFADPSPKDVIQGELGTCWFLSALALLAEKPFLLLNCIISQKYNPFGVHQVTFDFDIFFHARFKITSLILESI